MLFDKDDVDDRSLKSRSRNESPVSVVVFLRFGNINVLVLIQRCRFYSNENTRHLWYGGGNIYASSLQCNVRENRSVLRGGTSLL